MVKEDGEHKIMIVYQIILAIIMVSTIIFCDDINGKIIGFYIWGIFSSIAIVVKYKQKQMTIHEKINGQYISEYNNKYFDNFGELP